MRGVSVGINIGTNTTTAVVARHEKNGKIRIIGQGSSPSDGVRRGAVADAEASSRALKLALREASRASGVPIKSAYVGVGGAHINCFTTRGAIAISRADGEITEEDVSRVIQTAEGQIAKNPNREILHLIPREFKIDGQNGFADPVGMVGMKLEVEALAIDGAKTALQNLIRTCELASIEIEDWTVSILAAAETLLTKKQKELGAILLDLGAGTSDFAVFEESKVVDVGSFPIGGSHITSDIAIGFRTPVGVAEEIKIKHAQVFPAERLGRRENIAIGDFASGDDSVYELRDLCDITSARLSDIFELATKALKRIGRAGLLPGGVVLTGGVSDIPGIHNLARRELKLPVEIAKATIVDEVEDVVPPRLAVPLGLILWQSRRESPLFFRGRGSFSGFAERLKKFLRAFVP